MRERALWRVLPYLRPHVAKVVFITLSAFVSIASQLAIPLVVKAAIDGPITDGEASGLWPLFALTVGLAFLDLGLTYRAPQPALRRLDRPRDADARRPLRAAAAPRRRLPRPLAVGPAPVARHDRPQRHPALHRLRRHLLRAHPRAGAGDLRRAPASCTCRSRCSRSRPRSRCSCCATGSSAVHGDRPPHPGPDRRPHHHDRGGRQGHPRPQGVRPRRRVVRRLPGRGRRRSTTPRWSGSGSTRASSGCSALIPNLTLTVVLLAGVLAVGVGRPHPRRPGRLRVLRADAHVPARDPGVDHGAGRRGRERRRAASTRCSTPSPTIADRPGALALDDVRGDIRFEGVSLHLRGQRAHGAHRHRPRRSPAGEVVAVVGATGSGKTTLVTLLTRLYDPTDGPHHPRRPRPPRPHRHQPAPPRRLRLRGAVAVLGVGAREPADGQARRHRGRGAAPRSRSPRPASRSTCRGASTRASASRACRCPAASASASPWPGRSSAGRGSSCSTTRCRRVDVHTEAAAAGRAAPAPRRAAPCSSSCTARRRSRSPTALDPARRGPPRRRRHPPRPARRREPRYRARARRGGRGGWASVA